MKFVHSIALRSRELYGHLRPVKAESRGKQGDSDFRRTRAPATQYIAVVRRKREFAFPSCRVPFRSVPYFRNFLALVGAFATRRINHDRYRAAKLRAAGTRAFRNARKFSALSPPLHPVHPVLINRVGSDRFLREASCFLHSTLKYLCQRENNSVAVRRSRESEFLPVFFFSRS